MDTYTGADPGGRTRRAPPLKLEKIWFFGVKSWFFTRNTQNNFPPPSARRNFFKGAPPLTWNPGSTPDINLNMYIINVIADDESKIGLYEIYFLND